MWLDRSGCTYQLFPWPADGFGKWFHLFRSSASPFLKCKSRSRGKNTYFQGWPWVSNESDSNSMKVQQGALPWAYTVTALVTSPSMFIIDLIWCLCQQACPAERGARLLRSWHQDLFLEGTTFSSVQFSGSVVSDSLRPHESQHARPPCPSQTPNSCLSSRWCHPAISSSVVSVSSCPQSLPASISHP